MQSLFQKGKEFGKNHHRVFLQTDILIIGGGIVGMNIAKVLSEQLPHKCISLIEKENYLGQHSQKRTSGVLFDGSYNAKTSQIAQFCKEGNQKMTNYFRRNQLPIRKTGMIVVPVNDKQYALLLELYKRGRKNGISLQLITKKKARKIEPEIRCNKKYKVLYCPDVKTTKPKLYMKQLFGDLLKISNLRLYLGVQFSKRCESVSTRRRKNKNVQIEATVNDNKVYYEAEHVINVAGGYSCKIARSFGFSKKYCMFPIREQYLQEKIFLGLNPLNTLVYPVPKGDSYSKGVHLNMTPDGSVLLGRIAFPALSYSKGGIGKKFNILEFFQLIGCNLRNFFSLNGLFHLRNLSMTPKP